MSYTPTSWNTGDTITAAAMNKIENGIANAGGGGGIDCIIYTDQNGIAVYGDFASALAKVASGIPICVLDYQGSYSSGLFESNPYPGIWGWSYDETYPNQIKLYAASASGFIWDANGLTFWS